MKKAMPKKCPFCGMMPIYGTAENPASYWDGSMRGESYGYVMCEWCNLILKANDEEIAIRHWNRRGNWKVKERKEQDAIFKALRLELTKKQITPKKETVTTGNLQSCLDKFDAIADMIREKRGDTCQKDG